MDHIQRAQIRIEDLWAAGTDYSEDIVKSAREKNVMLHLDLDLTGQCKLNCFYCDRTPDRFNNVSKRQELSTADRKDIILQAKDLGVKIVEFTGAGEPMIDKGFWDLIEFINQNKMTTVLFTSGYHLDSFSIDKLFENNVTVFLKYNHTDIATQDQMVRTPGYGDKATKALQMLIEKGFNKTVPTRLAIDMVVTPKYQDTDEIVKIFRWCRKNNIHQYISTLIPEGLADMEKKLLERERCDQLIQTLQTVDREEFGLEYTPSRPFPGGYKCRQVNVGLFVNLFGEVYDCNGLGRVFGHIKVNSLKEIWNSKFACHIREPLQDGYCVLRERIWDGVKSKGIERKIEEYKKWKNKFGQDEVVEAGLEQLGYKGSDI